MHSPKEREGFSQAETDYKTQQEGVYHKEIKKDKL